MAVQGLKDGAADFVTKPWNNARLLQTLLHAATQTGNQPHNRSDDSPVNPPATTLEQMERRMISEALADNGGNLSATAERLGITRQTLYNKLKGGVDLTVGIGREAERCVGRFDCFKQHSELAVCPM